MRLRNTVRLQLRYLIVLLIFCFVSENGGAQERAGNASPVEGPSLSDSVRQLQLQIQQLQAVVQDIKEESDRFRAETAQLRRELQTTRERLNSIDSSSKRPEDGPQVDSKVQGAHDGQSASGPAGEKSLAERVAKLEEDQQLGNNKIEEQYQTKVESASKYRVRLSGIVLMNVFSNTGNVDHIEVPGVALPANPTLPVANTGGSFGATIRQSQLGLEIHGPSIAGAKTQGNFVADFFAEFPETINGWSSGMLRLRTGTIRLDWSRTSLVAGMDSLFFSPLYPTSFASVGTPALSYSGNLWGWMPQVRVEHRWKAANDSAFTISGGILDPLTGETPPNEFLRFPGAGESSRQPGYGARLEWSRRVSGQPLAIGIGGYYNRENWGFQRNIDGWVATMDWIVPFGSKFNLSGKFYSGTAIGGLGAGVGRSVVFNGALTEPATTVRGLQSTGGWAQLKFKPLAKLEFNTAAGQDGAAAGDVRGFTSAPGYFAANLTRNRSEFANFIYRPRSNLLFSTEFRALRTFAVDGSSQRANQLNLIMGVLF